MQKTEQYITQSEPLTKNKQTGRKIIVKVRFNPQSITSWNSPGLEEQREYGKISDGDA